MRALCLASAPWMRATDWSASSPLADEEAKAKLPVHGVSVEGEAGRVGAAMLAAVQHVDEGATGRVGAGAVLEHDSRDSAHGRSPPRSHSRTRMISASVCVLRPADVEPPISSRPMSSSRSTPGWAYAPAMPALRSCQRNGRESCGWFMSRTRRATGPPVGVVAPMPATGSVRDPPRGALPNPGHRLQGELHLSHPRRRIARGRQPPVRRPWRSVASAADSVQAVARDAWRIPPPTSSSRFRPSNRMPRSRLEP